MISLKNYVFGVIFFGFSYLALSNNLHAARTSKFKQGVAVVKATIQKGLDGIEKRCENLIPMLANASGWAALCCWLSQNIDDHCQSYFVPKPLEENKLKEDEKEDKKNKIKFVLLASKKNQNRRDQTAMRLYIFCSIVFFSFYSSNMIPGIAQTKVDSGPISSNLNISLNSSEEFFEYFNTISDENKRGYVRTCSGPLKNNLRDVLCDELIIRYQEGVFVPRQKVAPVLEKFVDIREEQGSQSNLQKPSVTVSSKNNTANFSIGIVTLSTPNRKNFSMFTQAILKKYAENHGYGYIQYDKALVAPADFVCQPNRFCFPSPEIWNNLPEEWGKIAAMRKHLHEYEWLVWIDDDIVITNMTIPLESFIEKYRDSKDSEDSKDLIIGKDPSFGASFDRWRKITINNGFFLLRNTNWSHRYLEQVWNVAWMYNVRGQSLLEQQAMTDCIETSDYHQNHIIIVDTRNLQSFLTCSSNENYQKPHVKWHPGDFAAHCGGSKRGELIEQLTQQGPEPSRIPEVDC